jgi:HNH endonuclease
MIMKKKASSHKYTSEELSFIKLNCKDRSFQELKELFNTHFSLSLKESQIKGVMARYGFKNGNDARFKSGHTPHNKDKKGVHYSIKTEFKPGHRPASYKVVGSARITRDGYCEVKIRDPNKWKAKHRIIWERSNGEIPPGYVILFADGNKQNIELDNLLMVSRKELVIMNREGLIHNNKDLTRTGQTIAALKISISDCTKRLN